MEVEERWHQDFPIFVMPDAADALYSRMIFHSFHANGGHDDTQKGAKQEVLRHEDKGQFDGFQRAHEVDCLHGLLDVNAVLLIYALHGL